MSRKLAVKDIPSTKLNNRQCNVNDSAFACQLNPCCSYRISEVDAVLPGPRCTGKYLAERGSEGWRACGCHTRKLCLSFRQRHFHLHSVFTLNFSVQLFLFSSYYIAFETHFHVLCCFVCQAQRVPVKKNHAEANGGAIGKMQNHCSFYLMRPNASLSPCLFTLT